jgi:hypothetical protein
MKFPSSWTFCRSLLSYQPNMNDDLPKALRLFDQTILFQFSNIDLYVLLNKRIA